MDNVLSKTDRIVEINGFNLFGHDDYRIDRRNVICYSNKLQAYITLNKLTNDNSKSINAIADLIYNNTFDDIKMIKVAGYY